MSVLSVMTGTAKFAWFRMLKNSARNWTLKFSEIFLTALFLKTEKSKSDVRAQMGGADAPAPRSNKPSSLPGQKEGLTRYN